MPGPGKVIVPLPEQNYNTNKYVRYSVVISAFAIVILSVLGSLYKVRLLPHASAQQPYMLSQSPLAPITENTGLL
ncbi:hypothetical protein GCM10025794_33850 [Massilia kyonggiensis]|jgi:hypothetical protein